MIYFLAFLALLLGAVMGSMQWAICSDYL